jgi:hypothetical protein
VEGQNPQRDNVNVLISAALSNNGMHPTADTNDFIFGNLMGRRSMPGVRPLENRKCVTREESQNGTTSVGSDLSFLPKEVTPYSSTSRHSHAVIAGRA